MKRVWLFLFAFLLINLGFVSASPEYPNEPVGFISFAENNFTNRPTWPASENAVLGKWWEYPENNPNTTILLEVSAPQTPLEVIQTRFSNGLVGGTEPVNFGGWDQIINKEYTKIYISLWIKINGTDYENQAVGTKIGFIGYGQDTSNAKNQGIFFLNGNGTGGAILSNFSIDFRQQNHINRNLNQNVNTSALMTVGSWHHLEAVSELNTLSQINGTLKMWIDGVLTHNYTNITYINSGNEHGFHGYKWAPTWGGVGGIKTRDDYMQIDHLYISGSVNSSNSNDTTAPVRTSGSPSGLFPYNTTSTTLSLTTNEAATCKYGTTANTAYSSIANTFSTTGSTSHSQTASGLTFNTTYNYYVRCNDTSNNVNTNDYTITFRISHGPDFTYNWNDWWTNETINFSLYNATHLQNISNVKFVNQYGRIQFLQNLNLSSDLNLAERIKVLDKKIWINSSLIPQFNKSAQLTFTGVGFSNPIIKIDGVDCPDTKCQNVTFNQTTGQYTFNVTSFSLYEIVEQCEDNVKNYDETGKDCGGKCGECKGNSWVWVLIGVLALGIAVYLFGMRKRRKRRKS